MSDRQANPYAGPRPFEESECDRFFGRSREIRQLASLVVARRAVVLYARSGAGKTSLLRAGLIPYLREHKRLRVLPILRVVGDSPAATVPNIFAFSVLQFLFGDRVAGEELVELTLAEGLGRYFAALPDEKAAAPGLLIVDQLEEMFTSRPELYQQRAVFFQQLRRCLEEHPQLSLLLSLREDSVAELDPYAALLPDRLRSRFRLELLSAKPALEAMQLPARHAGVELADALARQLVDELRTMLIQRPDGGSEEVLGQWVEPVHLQVVCRRLWSERRDDGAGKPRIEPSDLRAVGSIDGALASYYDQRVAAVAKATGTDERVIRDWLDQHLITEHGIRGQVLCGVGDSEGLANEVVEELVDARLVRCEKRRGATWFELAHDRLVAPVRASNTAWRDEHLRPMQQRADLWVLEGRPRSLVLSSGELRRELAWVETHDQQLTPAEQDLLAASRRARRSRRLGWLALVVTMLLAGSLWWLWLERRGRDRELARGLAAQSRSRLDEQLDLALLLSLEANRIDSAGDQVRGSLLTALQYQPRLLSSLHGHTTTVWSVAFGSDNDVAGRTLIASGDLDGRIILWDADRRRPAGAPLEGHDDGVLSLAFAADGRYLISTGRDRRVLLWDLAADPPRAKILRHDLMVTSAAFDRADDNRLITGDSDRQVSVWDLAQDPPSRRPLGEHAGLVTSLAVGPAGSGLVASGGADDRIRIWRLDQGLLAELDGHDDWVSGLAWQPAGNILVSASLDRTVRRWAMETFEELDEPPLEGPTDRLSGAAINPDGEVAAAATANGLVYLWEVDSGRSLGPPLAGNLALMRGLAFSPDGRILAVGSGRSVLLLDVADPDAAAGALGSPLAGGRGAVESVAFHPGGDLVAVAVGGEQAEIRILDARTGEQRAEALAVYPATTDDLAFSPDPEDGTLAEFGGDDRFKRIRRWDWAGGGSTVVVEEQIPSSIGQDPDRRELLSRLGDFARILEKALEPKRIEDCVAVRKVAFDRGGQAVAAESVLTLKAGVWVERWDVGTGLSLDTKVETTACVRSLAISPGAEILAAGTDEGQILLLTLADLASRDRLEGHVLPVRGLAFSPDGKLLASGGDDGIVHLWDLDASASSGRPLVGHTDAVHALAFDPQSRILASAGRDRTVILWHVATGLAIGRPLPGHIGPVTSLAFSPDGERLVSGGEHGTWLWQLGFEAWRERACRVANRDLTEEERELYLGRLAPGWKPVCTPTRQPP